MWLQRESFMGKRLCQAGAAGPDGGFRQRPVDDVALGVAAAKAVGDETRAMQQIRRPVIVAAPEGGKALDQRQGESAGPRPRFRRCRPRATPCRIRSTSRCRPAPR